MICICGIWFICQVMISLKLILFSFFPLISSKVTDEVRNISTDCSDFIYIPFIYIGYCDKLLDVTHLSLPQFKGEKGKFSDDFFARNQPVAQTQSYVNAREVMLLLMLKPGEYLIVPSTFKPNETASFILTILSKAETHVQWVTHNSHWLFMKAALTLDTTTFALMPQAVLDLKQSTPSLVKAAFKLPLNCSRASTVYPNVSMYSVYPNVHSVIIFPE